MITATIDERIQALEIKADACAIKMEELHDDVRDIKRGLFGDQLKDPKDRGVIGAMIERHNREDMVWASVCRGVAWSFGIMLVAAVSYYAPKILGGEKSTSHNAQHIESHATIPRDVSVEEPTDATQ